MGRISSHSLALLACSIALAGCAGGQKIEATPQFIKVECKRYSDAELKQALAELEKYEGQIPMLAVIVDDNGSLREAVCKKGKAPKKSG